ncbi:type II toxin-antitoxin system PemK/MazF family toxin [Thiothrix nivea]|uniref:mRNA interferase n=1 Tax=Thiothrix nivea (strain ATCC 35100 / DSM 5205 / JP2) TaxID=870187 RepID=A0A656HIX2_THINJ|nr:type II toxin-antitoxin system PemK/MazF family toxin [Thiothrix nivea]EIJ35340.1 transcriptional modulator of MazE/toxin, MazF [Thiothrix nivea DSM 5205]
MVIKQGEIYWVELGEPTGSEPGYRHPHIVLQNDVFNASMINTVVVCSLTSNLKRTQSPGNVLLKKGEANLTKASVVNISQIYTINKHELTEKIGKVSVERMQEVIAGVKLLIERKIL